MRRTAGCALAGLLVAMLGVIPAAADTLGDAREAITRGELRTAEIHLKNVLQREAENTGAMLLLAETYLAMERPGLARRELRRAQELGAPPADTLPLLARAYVQEHAFNRLLEEVRPHEDLPPAVRAELIALRGQAHLGLGRVREAAEAFERALGLDGNSLYAHLGSARLALKERDVEAVERHLEAARAHGGEPVELLLIAGELARLRQEPEAARRWFARALERRPDSTLAHLGAAAVALEQGELRVAGRHLAPVLEHTPNHPLANYLRAELAWREGRAEEAKGAVQLALGFLPGHLPSHLLLGAILYGEGDAEQAVRYLAPFVREVPEHAPARKLLAAAQLRLGRAEAALQTLEPMLNPEADDVALLSLAAAAHMRAGRFDRAAQLYGRVVELDPDAPAARGRLVVSLLASGAGDAASSQLERAVDLGLDPVETGVLRAQIALQANDPDAALREALALQRRAPDNPMGYNLAGVASLRLGNSDEARAAFLQALQLRPGFTLAAMNLAALELGAGNLDAARRQYRAVLQRRPGYVPAWMGLARVAGAAGDAAEVVRLLEEARAADAGAREPRIGLIRHHLAEGRGEAALEVARELAAAHPRHPDSLRLLGQAQQAVKLIKRSLDSFARLVELEPTRAENHYLYATALAEYGDLEGARDSLARALTLDPDHVAARVALGALEARAERPDAAGKVARDIQMRHPRLAAGFELEGDLLMNARAYDRAAAKYADGYRREPSARLARKLFEAYRRAGEAERAYRALQTWLDEHPSDTAMRVLLAQAYQVAGRQRAAIDAYRRVLEAEPERADVLNNLAWLVLEEQPEQALKWAERARELAPEDPAVLDTYGMVLLRQGHDEEAVRTLKEALLKAPQSSAIRYHLAVALERAGQWEDARRHVKQVLYTDPQFAETRAAEALLERLQERP